MKTTGTGNAGRNERNTPNRSPSYRRVAFVSRRDESAAARCRVFGRLCRDGRSAGPFNGRPRRVGILLGGRRGDKGFFGGCVVVLFVTGCIL